MPDQNLGHVPAHDEKRKTVAEKPEVQEPAALEEQAEPLPGIIRRSNVDPGRLRPAEILALQRSIGNQAVSGIKQSSNEPQPKTGSSLEPAGTLAEEPIDLSGEDSFSTTSYVDFEKEFERSTSLRQGVVQRNGTGIAGEKAVERYAGAAGDVYKKWGELTPEARANALGNLANDELKKIGSYPVTITLVDLGPTTDGQFGFAQWALKLNPKYFQAATISSDDFSKLVDTVYHELRHSEQWFRMARMLAGQGKTAAEIAKEMGIPNEAAQAAIDQPLKDVSLWDKIVGWFSETKKSQNEKQAAEYAEAAAWYDSVYGAGSAHREQTFKDLKKSRNDLESAKKSQELANQQRAQADQILQQAQQEESPADTMVPQAAQQLEAASQASLASEKTCKALQTAQGAGDKALEDAMTSWREAYTAYTTAKVNHQDALKKQAEAKAKVQVALAGQQLAYGKQVTALNDVAKASTARSKAYLDYRNLPEEADAWAVGGEAGATYYL